MGLAGEDSIPTMRYLERPRRIDVPRRGGGVQDRTLVRPTEFTLREAPRCLVTDENPPYFPIVRLEAPGSLRTDDADGAIG